MRTYVATIRTHHSAGHPAGRYTDSTVEVHADDRVTAFDTVADTLGTRSEILLLDEQGIRSNA